MGNKTSNSKSKVKKYIIFACIVCVLAMFGASDTSNENENGIIEQNAITNISEKLLSLEDIPSYSGSPYVVINGNIPYFEDSELTTISFERYSDLDSLGRCGTAVANVGKDIMPTEDRGSIGSVKPTGWYTVKYDEIDGLYLYNRCHLIGYQLTGENANAQNLITGTRYMNVEGMLPFENMVADYVKETGNHVMYRVTPIFKQDNLLASGVLIEAKSVEDDGEGILFNVYCYNVQPGINIDYTTGESSEKKDTDEFKTSSGVSINVNDNKVKTYVLNTSSKKFHSTSCTSINTIAEKNKQEYTGTRDEIIHMGYTSCGSCKP